MNSLIFYASHGLHKEKKNEQIIFVFTFLPHSLSIHACLLLVLNIPKYLMSRASRIGTALCSPIWLGGVLCYCFRKSRELNWYPLVLGWVHSIPTILDFLLKKFHFLPTLNCTRICVHPAVQPYCSPCTITAQFWKGETLTFCSGRGAVRGQRAGTVHSWWLWPYFTLCVWTHCGAHLSRKTTVKLC